MAKVVKKKKTKKVEVTLPVVEQPKTWYQKFWAFFKNSGTILKDRLFMITGTLTAAIGAMDWSPIWNTLKTGTYFTQQQLIAMGIGIVGAGIFGEIIRRRGTKEVNGNLLPRAE